MYVSSLCDETISLELIRRERPDIVISVIIKDAEANKIG